MSEERPVYRYTQSAGEAVIVLLLALLAITVALVMSPGEPVLFALGLCLALGLLVLHSVAILVEEELLTVRLGNGWIRWRIPREDIVSTQTVHLEGRGAWPVRRHEGCWVVGSGADQAVRITHPGGTLYVVTSEPIELTLALRISRPEDPTLP